MQLGENDIFLIHASPATPTAFRLTIIDILIFYYHTALILEITRSSRWRIPIIMVISFRDILTPFRYARYRQHTRLQ